MKLSEKIADVRGDGDGQEVVEVPAYVLLWWEHDAKNYESIVELYERLESELEAYKQGMPPGNEAYSETVFRDIADEVLAGRT